MTNATAEAIRPSRAALTARLLDYAERLMVVASFAWYMRANAIPHNALNFLIAATDVITVWFVLARRPATSVSLNPQDWALALGGTLLAMFARPGGAALISPAVALMLITLGTLVSLAAKLSLNRSFGVAPANRGVRMRGAYVFVRHPMYLGYALSHAAYLLMNPTALNAVLIGLTFACQWGRILREESWLLQDRAYRRYAGVVRFRIIPGLL